MSWTIHHTQSEYFASLAENAMKRNNLSQALSLYRLAAEQETLALDQLDPNKTRTLGIITVSAVSLWYKAKDFEQAQTIALRGLSHNSIPDFAVNQLKDLLLAIWKQDDTVTDADASSTHQDVILVGGREVDVERTVLDEQKEVQLQGILRNLHLDDDWLELNLVEDHPRTVRIYDAGDSIDDIVGPLVNHLVIVNVIEKSNRKLYLRDIQSAE